MSVFILVSKKGNVKECSNFHTIVFISHVTKVMLKILQVRLQEYINGELPDVQAGFRKRQRVLASAAHILKLERYRED